MIPLFTRSQAQRDLVSSVLRSTRRNSHLSTFSTAASSTFSFILTQLLALPKACPASEMHQGIATSSMHLVPGLKLLKDVARETFKSLPFSLSLPSAIHASCWFSAKCFLCMRSKVGTFGRRRTTCRASVFGLNSSTAAASALAFGLLQHKIEELWGRQTDGRTGCRTFLEP